MIGYMDNKRMSFVATAHRIRTGFTQQLINFNMFTYICLCHTVNNTVLYRWKAINSFIFLYRLTCEREYSD